MMRHMGNNNFDVDKVFGKRIVLRKIKERDLPILIEWTNSSEACGQYLSQEKFTREECYQKFHNNYFWNKQSKMYLIELKDNGKELGIIHYWTKPEDESTAMISVRIACPEFRRKGYGTETQIILIKHLFDIYKFAKIEMYTDIDNIPQHKCLDRLGFDFIEATTYIDGAISRTGKRYLLAVAQYKALPIYRYYFE